MKEEKYNGCSNETQLVKLHIENDQYTYECYKEMSLQAYEESNQDKSETINCIRNYIEMELKEIQEESKIKGLVGDLLTSIITRINAWKLAESFYNDFIEGIKIES